ncbi:MAG: nucleotidyltransferase family protein [Clostridia bacterium]
MSKNNVCGVILASGLSKRMGQNKLLLPLNDMTIFEHTLKACTKSDLSDIIVVTSYEEIADICVKNNVKFVKNEQSHLGQSESIKLGTKYFFDKPSLMFISGDTPFLDVEMVNSLISNFKTDILVPYFGDTPQNPVVFPKYTYNDLLKLEGDTGGKKVIKMHKFDKLVIKCVNKDIDTFEEYKLAKEEFND